jgi:precorrin-4/cobalt-precorrin-4 C11-methyltransferase
VKVYFVGAGPGDAELLTLKAKRIIAEADVVIYAGSLVNPEVLKWAREGAPLFNSATMTLEDVTRVFSQAKGEGKIVARIHSGDPSLFSALQEQMDWCRANAIEFQVVPGVSAFSAASAALEQELTLPGVTQTVILSRLGKRTPVPDSEGLRELARTGATLVLFLSVHLIEEVVGQLSDSYPPETGVAVVEKASWPEERVVRGSLADIAIKVKEAGISRTAIIIVGHVLGGGYEKSRLYDPGFAHSHRQER